MPVKNNANIGFEKQIWDAACVLWGHIPAAEYRKVIIGLIFYGIFHLRLKNAMPSWLVTVKVLKTIEMLILKKIFSLYRKKPAGQ